MDNNQQMAPIQPLQPVNAAGGMPLPGIKKDNSDLIKTVALIIVSLIAVAFIGLFIWMSLQYNEAQTDVQGKIDLAVAEAKDEQAEQLEAEFLEREKDPNRTFSGPADYGELTFKYPKNWSVYVADAATKGGDFSAYFNPNQVEAVSRDTIYALRLTIRDRSFDDVVGDYQKYLDQGLTIESITINGASANRYSGKIPGTDFNGYIVILKIRDKTAILQTDSVLFKEDFDNLIETVTFNA